MYKRGYNVSTRASGDVHTFAVISGVHWHHHLLPDLRELGSVTIFDSAALGFTYENLHQSGGHKRTELNRLLLESLRSAHKKKPVDWIFFYVGGLELSATTLQRIAEELGIPTVNMFLDDKHSWEGVLVGDQHTGVIDIAGHFDLAWTSARVACEWYLVEGGRPLYMPEGFDQQAFYPRQVEKDMPISFVGAAYGFRPEIINKLKRRHVPVQTFGAGWSATSFAKDLSDIFNRSQINLGMGGIGYSERLTNLKGRDFDVPGTGGGVYLTTYNADLAQHYEIGKEILCYQSFDELLELIRYYLARPDEAATIAEAGRQRCLTEHRWLHRYEKICRMLGVLQASQEDEKVYCAA